jgi:hypothetical protein
MELPSLPLKKQLIAILLLLESSFKFESILPINPIISIQRLKQTQS